MSQFNQFPMSSNFYPLNQHNPMPNVSGQMANYGAPWGSPLLADDPYSSLNYFGGGVPGAGMTMPTSVGSMPAPMEAMSKASIPGMAPGADSWWSKWMGNSNNPGPLGVGLKTAGGLASMFMGMKQYGLAKRRIGENTRQFDLNYDAQRRTTNAALEDRQRARVASNPREYVSVGEYMNKNAIR